MGKLVAKLAIALLAAFNAFIFGAIWPIHNHKIEEYCL
jgi:hypothetical protein